MYTPIYTSRGAPHVGDQRVARRPALGPRLAPPARGAFVGVIHMLALYTRRFCGSYMREALLWELYTRGAFTCMLARMQHARGAGVPGQALDRHAQRRHRRLRAGASLRYKRSSFVLATAIYYISF